MMAVNNITRKLPSKFELKRRAKARETEFLKAIQLMCGHCTGFFLDPYMPCTDDKCPLRSYYPTKGRAKSPSFKKDMVKLARAYDNPTNIMSEIRRLEPKFELEEGLKTAKRSKSMLCISLREKI